MDNIDSYYLNPNIDGSLQEFFDRAWSTVVLTPPVGLNVKELTLIALSDCIDAALDYKNKIIFLLLVKKLVKLK